MRIRSRNRVTEGLIRTDHTPAGPWGPQFSVTYGPADVEDMYEEMWDDTDTPGRGWKYCYHRVAETVNATGPPNGFLQCNPYWDIPTYFGMIAPSNTRRDWSHPARNALAAVPFSAPEIPDLRGYIGNPGVASLVRAADSQWVQISQSLDIGNDILELGQLIGLGDQFLSVARALRELEKVSPLRVINGTVNGFLAYNFGIAPLIGTIRGLSSAVRQVERRIAWLAKNNGKRARLTVSRTIPYVTPPPAGWPNVDLQWFRAEGTYRVTYFATLFSKLEGLDDFSAILRAYMAFMGLNNPLRIAWNAIPYSFLIDWCFSIGERLKAFGLHPFAGVWRISPEGYTSYGDFSVQHWLRSCGSKNPTPVGLTTWRVRVFERVPGILPTPTSWFDDQLSWLQQLLAGGLGWQRWNRDLIRGLQSGVNSVPRHA